MSNTKTVLITGAGSGIGRALTVEAVKLGFAPLIAGRTLSSMQGTARQAGLDNNAIVVADVTTPEGRTRLVAAAGEKLDILINNAGCLSVGHLSDLDDTALQRMCDTNLAAPVALTRDMLPALQAAQGRIVNIGSVFGDIAYPYFAAYSAMKFGLRGFSDAIRRELSGSGVGVTYVAPRATRTAAESEFSALVEPLQMTLDSAERVATEAWDAIRAGKRESFPRGKERLFVKIQRLLPSLVDKSVGAQARDQATLNALDTLRRA
ncbi:SDR family NAD(P)-dependent oxidoreductase [Ruegeria arenilitoris]|uniref:SDR family NAD(P)-dependent oxidoreductase n=1 Tax=Ruegeria arenilitoris TaxID=1173585 RepID=UPI00147A6A56|nr:SDR family NAD(P)-dependent oxidoreductase [Ruegeria arenilitoris]